MSTLFDRDVATVHHGDEDGLSEGILQSEKFILCH